MDNSSATSTAETVCAAFAGALADFRRSSPALVMSHNDADGLSAAAIFATANGIEPKDVDTAFLCDFVEALRADSLTRHPNHVHRRIAVAWKRLAGRNPQIGTVKVPTFRKPPRRVQPADLDPDLLREIENWTRWQACGDPFAADAREKALAAKTIRLRVNQLFSGLTALRDGGGNVRALRTLRDIVSPEVVKVLLGHLLASFGGKTTAYVEGLAKTLVAIARESVRITPEEMADLKKIIRRLPKHRH